MFLNYYHRYQNVKPDFMYLLLEENASLDNASEELSTLMTVLQTLTTGTFTCIPGTYTQQRILIDFMHLRSGTKSIQRFNQLFN